MRYLGGHLGSAVSALVDGAPYAQLAPQLLGMAASTALFLFAAARLFRWHDA